MQSLSSGKAGVEVAPWNMNADPKNNNNLDQAWSAWPPIPPHLAGANFDWAAWEEYAAQMANGEYANAEDDRGTRRNSGGSDQPDRDRRNRRRRNRTGERSRTWGKAAGFWQWVE